MKLTAKEIAEVLGISRIAVLKRAQKEKWLFVEEPRADGKGSPAKYYIVETLPEYVQEKVLSVTSKCNQNATKCNLSVTAQNGVESGISENGKFVNGTLSVTSETDAHYENGGITTKDEKGSLVGAGLTNFFGLTNEPNEPKNRLTNEPNKDEIWLSVNEVSTSLHISDRAVQKRCKNGSLLSRTVMSDKGFGGKVYEAALSCLPAYAQIAWVENNKERLPKLTQNQISLLDVQTQWKIVQLSAKRERAGIGNLTNEKLKERVAFKVSVLNEILSVPKGERRKKIEALAKRYSISPKTIYRDLKNYEDGGVEALAKARNRAISAWSPEALEYLRGVYLKAVKEIGFASKRRAYQITVEAAKKKGWKIGKESSAFGYLRSLNPLLEKYAKGGRRALDNVFYILRDLSDLEPFEIIVGDQHRFDFWVKDAQSGEIFRPECFLWLDMRTRLVYGISVAKKYDKYIVGHAMRMGLLRFGKFKSCYTDNGRPELSHYVNQIIGDIARYGEFKNDDVANLYKSEEGYVIESAKGGVEEIVETSYAWHKKAKAYNAKAKPIERFFRTFEALLRDLGIPGAVRSIRSLPEDAAMDDKRLKNLIKNDRLFTFDEFLLKLFDAIEIYNTRKHSSLKRSPTEELMYAYTKEGFTPRFIDTNEIDFILLARAKRRVSRGRIQLNQTIYEGEEINDKNIDKKPGLWHLPDKTLVEIRYDIFNPKGVIAILPDGDARYLHTAEKSSMKNRKLTSKLIGKKRQMIDAVVKKYKALTQPIPKIVEYSKQKRISIDEESTEKDKKLLKENFEDIRKKAQKMVEESQNTKPIIAKRRIFKSDWEYYKWTLEIQASDLSLSAKDRLFVRKYEEKMDEDERSYWDAYRKVLEKGGV